MAIFVTCLISENKYKQLSVNSSPRSSSKDKDKDTNSVSSGSVKIGKTATSTYNRTMTGSSSIQNTDLLASSNPLMSQGLDDLTENDNLLLGK